MNSAFRIKETLYIETTHNNIFPLIPAGRTVPATWEQTFGTSAEDQRSFDMNLLRGNAQNIRENTSIGKWRIGGDSCRTDWGASDKGCNSDRCRRERWIARYPQRPTPSSYSLTEEYPKIPLTFRVPTIPIDQLINQPCPECKRSFVIRNINWRQEPFALCLDCGHQFEMPNSLSPTVTAPWEDLPTELVTYNGDRIPPYTGWAITRRNSGFRSAGL